MPTLLIVNADDWGGETVKTDAIRAAWEERVISSATAMVYMPDSDRAAQVHRGSALPLGLHLNLTQELGDPKTPAAVRARQDRLREHFADLPRRRRTYSPRLRAAVRAAIDDQLGRFVELYGARPDHIDGHEHVHLCLDVLFALPRGTKIRTTRYSRPPSPWRERAIGAARGALIRSRLRAPARMFPIQELTAGGLDEAVALSRRSVVEIMCHPGMGADDEFLRSERWRAALARAPLGSYADL